MDENTTIKVRNCYFACEFSINSFQFAVSTFLNLTKFLFLLLNQLIGTPSPVAPVALPNAKPAANKLPMKSKGPLKHQKDEQDKPTRK